MIELNESLFLGRGCHKETYIHPLDNNICLKILINKNKDAKKQLIREIKHHIRLQKKLKTKKISGLSNYLGKEKTNLGNAFLFEIVKDYDGNISKSLQYYLSNDEFKKDNNEKIKNGLNILKENLINQQIIPMEIEPQNILYKKLSETEFDLIIIDDIGTASLIPLEYYIRSFGNRRINRKWSRFIKKIYLF